MIAIIACGSDSVDNIAEIVTKLGYKNNILEINTLSEKDFIKYEAIIISGSGISISEDNKKNILKKFKFLGKITIPVLGISFGHQVIGSYFSSQLKILESIDGPAKINIVNRGEELFKGIRKKIFYENHSEEITLPTSFRLLAYSQNCQNEAMKHIDKNIFGVQFHPELSGSAGVKLIDNFFKISIL